jgi:hypothetical protein
VQKPRNFKSKLPLQVGPTQQVLMKSFEREMGLINSYKLFLVFDAHHKPRGLSCHLPQVHKVQHKPTKKLSWGLYKVWSKRHALVLLVAHRTLSGA